MKKTLLWILPIVVASLLIANSLNINIPGTNTSVTTDSLNITPQSYMPEEDQLINTILSRYHYRKFKLNDSLSSVIFGRYVKSLDNGKSYFYASDIKDFDQYKTLLDNDIQNGDLNPPYKIFNTFKKRVIERINYVDTLLNKGFDFTKNEKFLIDRDSVSWPQTQEEINDLWRKKVKNDALNLLLAGKKWEGVKETLQKRYANFRRAISQYNSEDVFQLFMNSYTEAIDPHTNYLSPSTSENFKIDMSRSLEGIGAQLQQEDDYTKVNEIIPGGPAFKSGLLKRNDKIIGVAQGKDGEMVDVIGWRLTDVVQLIRGPKGTIVRLDIIPSDKGPNAIPHEITIVRDKVTLEEQSAKKSIINIDENNNFYKIGVITLPAFYIDFEARQKGDPNYKSTTRDVRKLIKELKEEKVDGIIMDLRNNGGGALDEAVNLTGLFIKDGPVVQVKSADGKIDVDSDSDPDIVYNGPLAVLVNRFSASASEIFTGAIQNYERGIIVGEQTYGKGSVQNLIDLNRLIGSTGNKFGQVKLTIAKYYRIDGGSTQNKGVVPDIKLPSAIDPHEFGESSEPSALPWDQIRSTKYVLYSNLDKYIPELKKMHDDRMDTTTEFDNVLEDIREYKESKNEKYVSLNETVRKKEKEEEDNKRFERENDRRKHKGLKLLQKGEKPTTKEDTDPYLEETGHVLADLIKLSIG
ncbi:MAG: carboxy terminal-processing peptidase [Ignavibacteriaceae bacterium]